MPENNFGLIRHCAALAVLVSHSVALTTGQEATELGMRLTRNQMTLGHLAVFTFFILSGYLITQSWQRRPQLGSFLIARAGRLLPGLALSLVGCVVAGAVVTTLPVVDYAADPATGQFVWLNLSLLGFAGPLPGVFAGHPVPAVNGSLWTLQYEATCYAILAGLGLAGLLRGWVVLAMLAAGLVAGKLWLGGALVEFGTCFLGGMAMAVWRPPVRAWALLLCGGVLITAAATGGLRLACATAGAYLMIAAATARPLRTGISGGADYSYGIYLWAFPVQQLVVGWGLDYWAVNIAVSLPIVLACAWLSWHGVERPALLALRARRSAASLVLGGAETVGGTVR